MILDAELFQSPEVDRTGATVGAKDLVALVQQQLGEVSTVLAGDAGNNCTFHLISAMRLKKSRSIPNQFGEYHYLSPAMRVISEKKFENEYL